MDEFKKIFDKVFLKIKLEYNICGSYRRGNKDCGDIDLLVTAKRFPANVMSKILIGLKNVLVDDALLTPNAKKN